MLVHVHLLRLALWKLLLLLDELLCMRDVEHVVVAIVADSVVALAHSGIRDQSSSMRIMVLERTVASVRVGIVGLGLGLVHGALVVSGELEALSLVDH